MKTREVVFWTVGIIVFVAVDAVVWLLSGKAAVGDRPALISAASAWGIAGVTLGAGLLAARRSHHYASVTSLRNERRAVYARLVSITDQFDATHVVRDDAKKAQEAAKARVMHCEDPVEREQLEQDFHDADERYRVAAEERRVVFEAFRDARGAAVLLASPEVGKKLNDLMVLFRTMVTLSTSEAQKSMKQARDAFLDSAMRDLATARRPKRPTD